MLDDLLKAIIKHYKLSDGCNIQKVFLPSFPDSDIFIMSNTNGRYIIGYASYDKHLGPSVVFDEPMVYSKKTKIRPLSSFEVMDCRVRISRSCKLYHVVML